MTAPDSGSIPRSDLLATLADVDTAAPLSHEHTAPDDFTATGTPSDSTALFGDNTWKVPANTTYSVMSEAEATAGTASTARTLSAARLKGAVQRWVTGASSTAVSAIGRALNSAATAEEARDAIAAVADDDSRLTNARPPTGHTHPPADAGAEPAQWYGTQSQYDALGTKDPDRTYNILED